MQHCVTGTSKDTGQLTLGFYQDSGHVQKLSSVKHNYPDHVMKAAEVGLWQTGWSYLHGVKVLSGYNFIVLQVQCVCVIVSAGVQCVE
jgi:hypothetical protein